MKIRKLIIILMTMIIMMSNIMVSNVNFAATPNKQLEIKAGEEYSHALAYKNAQLRFVYTYYINEEGKEQPVYCLDKTKPGADQTESKSYTVKIGEKITDIKIWRILMHSYPYVDITDMGCDNKYQCYVATQAALYCVLYDWSVEKYKALTDEGDIIITSIKNLINYSNDDSITTDTVRIRLIDCTDWTLEEVDGKIYLSKVFSATNPKLINDYTIRLRGAIPIGTLVTGIDNQVKDQFEPSERFKILIPRDKVKERGVFTVDVYSEISTRPIYRGVPNGEYQPYAITGIISEQIKDSRDIGYKTIGGTLIINKMDKETNDRLADAIFNVYDSNENLLYSNLITDENGEIKIYNLEEGKYYIEEVEAPEGYKKIEEKYEVDVFSNSQSNVNVMNTKPENVEEETHNVVVEIVENNKETTIKTENDYHKYETNNKTETNIEINNTIVEKENNNTVVNDIQNNNTTILKNNTSIKNNISNKNQIQSNNTLINETITEKNNTLINETITENNNTLISETIKENNNKIQNNINTGKKLPKTGM